MSKARMFMTALIAGCLLAPGAMAVTVGDNATIDDQHSSSGGWLNGDQWYRHSSPWVQSDEDNEVEPGTLPGDDWDLEGFFIRTDNAATPPQTTLSMVGTYDFLNGANDPRTGTNYASGDLFIDVTGDALYGTPATLLPPIIYNGYDFVLDLDFSTGLFNIVDLHGGAGSVVQSASIITPESDPWAYVSGGATVASGMSLTLLNDTVDDHTLRNADLSTGGARNIAQFDWDEIVTAINTYAGAPDAFTDFTLHFTMGCGNDNLMGNVGLTQAPPVPEPASMALLGLGVLGIAMRRRFTA